ncbi:toll/interleukin-1 receptor domain-containing protein [Paenibacillus sp. 8b26]|uniref:toll/interleukin-1 receptor domain-containing protein n=1 Tax=Paenibacillus sp. 8b26 TaxID=3424133 RepID=UPI003D65E0C5
MEQLLNEPLSVFVSYSHRDEELKDELLEHLSLLKREKLIKEWNDRYIIAGDNWNDEIITNFKDAQIILLLVSSSFINSEFCWHKEMLESLERHRSKEASVIPIILRPCEWHSAPFGEIQALPKDGKAVTMWENKDFAYLNIAAGIRERIRHLQLTVPKNSFGIQQLVPGDECINNAQKNLYLQILKNEYGVEWLNGALKNKPNTLNFMANYPKKIEKMPCSGDTFYIGKNDEIGNLVSPLRGKVERASSYKSVQEIINESKEGIANYGFHSHEEFEKYIAKQKYPSENVFCVTLKDIDYKELIISEGTSKFVDLKHGLYMLDREYDIFIYRDRIKFENIDKLLQDEDFIKFKSERSEHNRSNLKKMDLF